MANTATMTARRARLRHTVAQRVRRWYGQLQVNLALEEAGILGWDGFSAAQRATWDALSGGRIAGQPVNAVEDAVLALLRADMGAAR